METSELIRKLSADITTTRSDRRGEFLLTVWFLLGGIFGGFFLWRVGLTPDLGTKLGQWDYVAALILLGVAYVTATTLSLRSAQPGAVKDTRRADQILGLLIFLSLCLYGGLLSGEPKLQAPVIEALGCCVRITFGAMLPNLTAAMIVSRLAPVETKRIVKYSMISSLLLISIVSQLNCPVTDFTHIMTGHGLFLILAGAMTYYFYLVVFRLVANASLRRRLGDLADQMKSKIS